MENNTGQIRRSPETGFFIWSKNDMRRDGISIIYLFTNNRRLKIVK
ncbi:hypothetical protein ACQCT6_16840 [Cytobacillus gottheilii]